MIPIEWRLAVWDGLDVMRSIAMTGLIVAAGFALICWGVWCIQEIHARYEDRKRWRT